jgi:hypothetical protein
MGWPLHACFSDYRHLKRDGIDAELARGFAGGTLIETASSNDT